MGTSFQTLDTIRKRAWPKLVGLYDYYVDKTENQVSPRNGSHNELRKSSKWEEKNECSSGLGIENSDSLQSSNESLIGANSQDTENENTKTVKVSKTVPGSLDAEQIDRDVSRCTWHLLTGNQRSRRTQMENKHRKKVAVILRKKQKRLGNLINLTLLRTNEDDKGERLRYYQGYHDVASIFLSSLGGGGPSSAGAKSPDSIQGIASSMGLDLASSVLAQISTSHFRDAMKPNFLQLQTAIRLLLMPLICYFDREVHDFLHMCEMEPFFSISWVISWFSHDIHDTTLVKRLFDAFIVSHPLLPLYMAVAMVCHPNNREEILMTECDFAPVHSVLSSLPKNSSLEGVDFTVKPPVDDLTIEEEFDNDVPASEVNSVFVEGDLSFNGSRDCDDAETQSLMSSASTMGSTCGVKAPFQEILNLALNYMERFPPKHLLKVSKRYFFEEQFQPLMDIVPSISLFHPHPSWGLRAQTPADWVLKQRRCAEEGRSLNRRGRRERKKAQGKPIGDQKTNSNDDSIMVYLRNHSKDKAVIACGYGRGEEEFVARRRLRRIALATVAISIIVSVAVVYIQPKKLSSSKQMSQGMEGICNSEGSCPASKGNIFSSDRNIVSSRKGKSLNIVESDAKRPLSDSSLEPLSSSNGAKNINDSVLRSSVKAALGSRKFSVAKIFKMVKEEAIESDSNKFSVLELREGGQVYFYESVTSFLPKLLKTAVRSIGKFFREMRNSLLEASDEDESSKLLAFFL